MFFLNFRSSNLHPELTVFHSSCQSSFSCSLFGLCSHLAHRWNLGSYETRILVLLHLNPYFRVINLSSTCAQVPISPTVRNTIIRAVFLLQDNKNCNGLLKHSGCGLAASMEDKRKGKLLASFLNMAQICSTLLSFYARKTLDLCILPSRHLLCCDTEPNIQYLLYCLQRYWINGFILRACVNLGCSHKYAIKHSAS